MVYDAVIGMDATIEVLALHLRKPMVLLDKPSNNMAEINLKLHRLSIKKSITELKRDIISLRKENKLLEMLDRQHILRQQQSLLNMTDIKLMISYIKEMTQLPMMASKIGNQHIVGLI